MQPRKSSSNRPSRGFSIPEVLTVIVIVGLTSAVVAQIAALVFGAPNREQAKVDTINAAVQSLYKMQRETRQSDAAGVFACTTTATPTCTQPTSLTQTSALVVVTPKLNGAPNIDATSGQPKWQGFFVYWLQASTDPNNAGNFDLKTAFVANSTLGSGAAGLTPSNAQQAVTSAMAGTAGTMATGTIKSLTVAILPAQNTVRLQLAAQTIVGGRINETSFASDIFARN